MVFFRAADEGVVEAQAIMGTWYSQGKGVPQNYAEAMKWFRRAADQDNSEAQLNLGILYESGPRRQTRLRRRAEMVSRSRDPQSGRSPRCASPLYTAKAAVRPKT